MRVSPLKAWLEDQRSLLRLRLACPKANLIDATMIAALDAALDEYLGTPELRGILLDADGPHFSFGASVEEHFPAQCVTMLHSLHSLLLKMLAAPVPILTAVQGHCLGGGLELACATSQIFAANNATFGQPEIRLGVFAPAASCLLPERIGQTAAEDLLFTGRNLDADEALDMGLVQNISDDPAMAAHDWFRRHLAPLSASSLYFAVHAARLVSLQRIRHKLAQTETIYNDELMSSHDALEGLTAFMEKRPAHWHHN